MIRTMPNDEKLKKGTHILYNSDVSEMSYPRLKTVFGAEELTPMQWKKIRSTAISRTNFKISPELGFPMLISTVKGKGVTIDRDEPSENLLMINQLKKNKRRYMVDRGRLLSKSRTATSSTTKRQLIAMARQIEESTQAMAARALMENIISKPQFDQLMLGTNRLA